MLANRGPFSKSSNSCKGFSTDGPDLSNVEAWHTFLITISCKRDHTSLTVTIYAYLDLASTKSSYSPNWRVQNMFGEYEIEVTRQFGEYEFFLMSNPVKAYNNFAESCTCKMQTNQSGCAKPKLKANNYEKYIFSDIQLLIYYIKKMFIINYNLNCIYVLRRFLKVNMDFFTEI